MAYTKNTWNTGDIVTSEKLNHMEDGIAGGGNIFVVGGVTVDSKGQLEGTLDKTWQEVHDAMLSKICILITANDIGIVQELITDAFIGTGGGYGGGYVVTTSKGSWFTTSTANGYPAAGDGGNGSDSPK